MQGVWCCKDPSGFLWRELMNVHIETKNIFWTEYL